MSNPPWHVVKLGGSLLARPDLANALEQWLACQRPAHTMLVVGGGQLVDALRQYDQLHGYPAALTHRLAIDLLDVTSDLVGHLLPTAVATDQLPDLAPQPQLWRLRPSRFLQQVEPWAAGTRLEVGWHVTSDSIAARVAECLAATRLTLLKSAAWPADVRPGDWVAAAAAGYVDEQFGRWAAAIASIDVAQLPAV